ncbi:hypothetical protein, partial [Pseudoalteromonas sp. GABNS16H]|uniref:hypothetical protein n=1 Tax=Pseudoalteromonas sp. GABNS16H TaxID=3025325 RepID=UPI00235F7322
MDENEKRLLEIKQKAAWSSKQKENERALAKRREDRKIVLKFAFLAAALLILAVYYFSNWTLLFGEKSSQKEWYEGGTLHDATIRQWLDATYDNKRATAGDWVTSVLG